MLMIVQISSLSTNVHKPIKIGQSPLRMKRAVTYRDIEFSSILRVPDPDGEPDS